MFSRDSSFQAALASSPGKLREACASRGLDQPGALAAYMEDMEQPALPTDIGVGPSSLPASSSSLPPSPPLEFSTSVVLSLGKATAKRVRSRKVEKGKAKRTAQMVDEVESGGDVLGNAGGSLGQMVVWSSVPDGFSEGSHRSKGGSDSFDDFSFASQSAETPYFHGLSQNLESCGVPARLKTSELSAHQMPKILKAERSSNASPAARRFNPGSMGAGQQRVLQFAGKRRAIARRIRGQLCKTCAEGTASSEKYPEEDCHNVAHGSWARIEGKASSKSSCRGDEEDSHGTAHSCQRTGPQEGKDKACDDEFLWSHSSARRRKSREESMVGSPGNAPRGHAYASWTKTGGETCCVQQ